MLGIKDGEIEKMEQDLKMKDKTIAEIKWNKLYTYPKSTRSLIHGQRHYDVGTKDKLPSVTTI